MPIRGLWVLLLIVFQLMLNIGIGVTWAVPYNTGLLPAGVKIAGVSVGGLTKAEAVDRLTAVFPAAAMQRTITVENGKRHWLLATAEMGIRYDYTESVADIIASTAKQGSGLLDKLQAQVRKSDYPLRVSYNVRRMQSFLNEIYRQTYIPPRDASILYHDGRITVQAEHTGRVLNRGLTKQQIVRKINTGDSSPVRAVIQTVKPRVNRQDLAAIDTDLAVYVTRFTGSLPNRINNIRVAAGYLNGAVILPDEVFSFNDRTGERIAANGFKTAPQISNSQLVSGTGGGVCQVATTLYNAGLLAGLTVVERTHHSLPVNYVPVGMDATVAGTQVDLKFKNNFANPVCIVTEIREGMLIIRILGNTHDKQEVKLVQKNLVSVESPLVVHVNAALPAGTEQQVQKGHRGYRVTVYRIIGEGNAAKQECISQDYYRPVNTVVEMGVPSSGEIEK